ncbi:MAG: hypothetical protein ABI614_16635 [Planctomycetota bacterium]
MRSVAKSKLYFSCALFTTATFLVLSSHSAASDPVQSDDCSCTETASCSDGGGSSCGCEGGHGGGYHGSCSMPPHYMYFPQSHENYYFRPYNYQTILRQQQSVGRYGGDRRNPYDNSLFQPLYDEMHRESLEEIFVPDALSTVKADRPREIKSASRFTDERSRPPKVHVETAPMTIVKKTPSDSAFRARLISDKN